MIPGTSTRNHKWIVRLIADPRADPAGRRLDPAGDRGWSPQINTGAAVLIPEAYVPDLNVRLALYRRLSEATIRDRPQGGLHRPVA